MPKWTDDQIKAIENRGHDILVSAAAGSGKTTILIERILRELKGDADHQPEDIENLLVVTFTEAAAQEMKERLLTSLKKAVATTDNPDIKRHLQKQIFHVPMANISTIHAFCLSVIKKFYYVIDLDPNFRLLSDDTERLIIQEQAYDLIRDAYYGKGDADFINLTNNFTNDRSDDGLKDIVFKTYDFAITNRDTDAWLDSLVKPYQFENSFIETDFYQNEIIPQIKQSLEDLQQYNAEAIDFVSTDELGSTYLPVFDERDEKLGQLVEDLPGLSFEELRNRLVNFKITAKKVTVRAADKKDKDTSIMDAAKGMGDEFNRRKDKILESYFLRSEAEVNQSLRVAEKLITKLVEVERRFMKKFADLKNNAHVLDFSDLEHKAVEILTGAVDGRKIAQEYYQTKFHELMIDEYQDVNEMQDRIVDLLSSENNHRFMVGDIKQSIYGFRQAAPRLFTEKYDRFQKSDNDAELVQLSKNFRSSKAVDDFVNQIFTRIFDKQIGDIDYDEKAKLVTGTNFPDSVDSVNEFDIYLAPKTIADAATNQVDGEEDLSDQAEISKRQTLISAAAKRIQALIDEGFEIYDSKMDKPTDAEKIRPLKYSDIAILARTRDNNTDIVSYFSKVNIPVMVTDAQNYFQTTELQIMMAMLNIVDNPYQDIPLVAVLRSPIVGLNEEELAEIRLADKRNMYYTAIQKYLNQDADEHIQNKLKSFLLQLESYRDFSNKNSIARLIWKIYQETGLLEYVSGMPGGKQRAANLHALYQRANAYEENNFKGLHQFISFIQRMQDLNKDLAQPNSIEANDDTVKVMTVHGSKGLEFPIVIYLDMDKNFNLMDVHSNTVFDAQRGIGITIDDNDSRLQYRTMQRGIISNQKKISTVSEEMRLLYVALTRAKQKLIMLGFTKNETKLYQDFDKSSNHNLINSSARLGANNFQNLVGMSTVNGVDEREYFDPAIQLRFRLIPVAEAAKDTPKIIIPETNVEDINQTFKDSVAGILDFKYPHQEAVETTAYQSVSEIKGLFADPDDDNMAEDLFADKSRYNLGSFGKPQFLTQKKKVTNAEVGSATHLVLQKIAIDQTPKLADFEELVQDLVNQKLLTDELAAKIDCQSLADFYQSDLGQLIVQNHDRVSREFPCSILMPAEKLFKTDAKDYSTNDKILVHGIIDGVIELDSGITIFDYKTDHVTAENHAALISKYSGQVNLYAEAISAIKNQPVEGKYLYFLKTNEAVNLQENKDER
ncbi:helicase-exonuclease AddAB subunit AddA [Companilactobacillus nantensis]|uniref:ATP-dependent helicase/nuclease subunit A n=1 Tax=Companilactobacillus nantensis DSM 16982 TaxID=1423774 RepID=A0A0R1WL15_9LACO|nr:helicase-exonuclease AddAB subunit AddA [Companilactobacillus nantensis]KRM18560.1 ATP-dependent nuclease subunit A [Companilactobacillus nantensis DSM 16982]GEO63254.1 ATP-dependent helicase/nuclease subunit A [Companilactobacillus nantensis]